MGVHTDGIAYAVTARDFKALQIFLEGFLFPVIFENPVVRVVWK